MKVHKINTKLIKPQTPTPENLKKYNISFVDQFMEHRKFGVVLFYESKPENKKQQLEESLAKTLVQFYPLAGRYMKNDHLVDCNDDGAEFVETEALDIELMDLVTKTEIDQLNHLFPADEDDEDPLLSIQATHFPCGGLTISIRVSHTIFDAASLWTFIAAWSNSTNPDSNKTLITPPSFPIPSLLPYMDLRRSDASKERLIAAKADNEITVKRLVFNKEAIARLRSKIKLNMINGKRISRVRVVCAVIATALIRVDRANHGKNRSLAILQPINMRERTFPPQPKHACGNFAIPSQTQTEEIGMEELVHAIGESVEKNIADYGEILSPDRDGRSIIMNALGNISKQVWDAETNAVCFTDWSKFGFYGADFGWGKPVWTGIPSNRPVISSTVLMSDREGDGIEAWLHLKVNDMRLFEQDEDISNYLLPSN
ncbi:hypothetical protein C2S53_018798 [Perilla frutescens var. hirtella]|uniref:Uncharacterized protein n=1 Tax=Perilla frutescens var. hirtella TaxID=608512 RepID=A0AAD4NWX7_PERFH|nr:hypothetical protein C2S53_018798 [Perilla frutescens var. hirtella]